jgi:hypothetical protein
LIFFGAEKREEKKVRIMKLFKKTILKVSIYFKKFFIFFALKSFSSQGKIEV